MQAWVKSNGGPEVTAGDQPAPTDTATTATAPSELNVRMFKLGQGPFTTTTTTTTNNNPHQQDNNILRNLNSPPPRSRTAPIHANSDRTATARTMRLARPTALSRVANHPRTDDPYWQQPAAKDLVQQSQYVPFWDGSTVDNEFFSDTASNLDAAPTHQSQPLPSQPFHPAIEAAPEPQAFPAHYRPFKGQILQDEPEDEPQIFRIGPNGFMDVVGHQPATTRNMSPPNAGAHGNDMARAMSEVDAFSEGSQYHGSAGKGSPSAKKLHHSKPMALRTNPPTSFSERARFMAEEDVVPSPPQRARPSMQGKNEGTHQEEASEPARRVQVRIQEPRRSVFAGPESPTASNTPSEEDVQEQQVTPKASNRQIARQLFPGKENKGKTPALHESSMPRPSSNTRKGSGRPTTSSRKRPLEPTLDYDDSALSRMDYAALKAEAFDFDPAQAEALHADHPPRTTLPEKLEHYLGAEPAVQTDFFSKLPVNDWEESGDWMLTRFTDIVTRLRKARRDKRTTMEGFEQELAARAEAVKAKDDYVESKLSELKADGEGLMQGMAPEEETIDED